MVPSPSGSPEIHRILHVFRAPVGGLFRHVLDLARLQAEAGHRVGIVCDAATGGARADRQMAEILPHLDLGLTRLPMRRGPGLSDLVALEAVRRTARRTGASVLHGHGAKGGIYARLAGGRGRAGGPAPIRAYTPHGGSYHYATDPGFRRLYMAIEAALALRTDVFLFESAYVAGLHHRHVGRPRALQRVVHNGLAPAEFEPVARLADRFDLVHIGELRALKGIAHLLDALAALRDSGRALRLLLVGAGPDEAVFRARIAALGLGDLVALEPPQPIRSVLGRARAMVVSSLAESLPYVVLEAAAAGQPLVATDVGGIPEIFGAQADALVRPGDAAALGRAILRTLDADAADRAARAADLRESVRARFSHERMLAEVLAGYAAAARARTRRTASEAAVEAASGATAGTGVA